MTNAIAHTPTGGKVTIKAVSDRTTLTVDVSDSGCGIAADHLPQIFNRFLIVPIIHALRVTLWSRPG